MGKHTKSRFELIIRLIKVMIWPLLVLFVMCLYHSDIKRIIDNTNKVSVGTFSMEIMKEAKSVGFSELGVIITDLNKSELKLLLSISNSERFGLIGRNSTEYFLPENTRIWAKLEEYDLVEFENFTLKEVEENLINLGAKKEIFYYNDKGEYSIAKSKDFHIKSYMYMLDVDKLSKDEKIALEHYSILLTKKGKQAIDIIINTIIDELNR